LEIVNKIEAGLSKLKLPIKSGFGEPRRVRRRRSQRNGVTAFRDLISSELKMRDEWFKNP
jgi:hypothetical protein